MAWYSSWYIFSVHLVFIKCSTKEVSPSSWGSSVPLGVTVIIRIEVHHDNENRGWVEHEEIDWEKDTWEQVAIKKRGERSKGEDYEEKQKQMGKAETKIEVKEAGKGE